MASLRLTEVKKTSKIKKDRPDLSILDMSREEILRRYNESHLSRRQYFSHLREPIMTIRPNGIKFNKKAVTMINSLYIFMRVFKEEGLIFVEAAEEDDIDSQQWANLKEGKKEPRQITGWPFASYIYHLMDWCKGYSYNAYGSMALKEEEGDQDVLCFELRTADQNFLTKKAREQMHISLEDLGDDWGLILEEDERREKEKAQREKDKAEGKTPKPKKKTTMKSKNLEKGEVGPKAKDHVKRIRIPRTTDGQTDLESYVPISEEIAESGEML